MGHSLRVVDHVVEFLREQQLTHVFGVGGANIEDLYDAIDHAAGPVRGLVAKHEYAAVSMADGHHRATGRPAVVAVTSGAGAMNAVPGLAELRASGIPALALVGQPPVELDGLGSFQETSGKADSMDALRLFGEIGVYCARVNDPAAITEVLPAALEAALSEVPGPAILLLPKDVQQSVVPPWEQPPRVTARPRPLAPDATRREAVRLLTAAREAQGIAIMSGTGVVRGEARAALERLSDALDANVAVAPDAKDAFDNHHPRFLGVTGAIGHAAARERIESASAVLLAGTRLPQLSAGPIREHLKGVPLISVDSRPPLLGAEHPDLIQLDGPLSAELDALTALLTETRAETRPETRTGGHTDGRPAPGPPAEPTASATPTRSSAGEPIDGPADGPADAGLSMRQAVEVLAGQMPDGAVVVVDAGNTGATVIHHLPTPRGGRFIVAQGMGGMGHSFGAGIGACMATGAPTYVIAGDGSFLMHGMEIHTAAQFDLPITYLILNNNAHAMCHTREQVFFAADYTYNLFSPSHIAAGVDALFPSVAARHARDAGELRRALAERAADPRGPALVEVEVDPHEVPPFTPFQRPPRGPA
ncbi:thiamine pyrophosphate-binding protein [Streptomyces sp. AJS327]|uniref:thiamine pyrophosphate-binding protein n=1 Tax=Streptomyces sp. AJS327 TaxID=2545265 RepID=UPI0015DE504B|nr:thiamine pyrophosphate-binding protein [Streptomyces sp. AJS327]MBA0053323.1 thiamine pyrophosphate-binding protein [Streptomyces sp. AJS327]